MAITDNGEMYAWGWNRFGQLGLGTSLDTSVATRVIALEKEKVRVP
jgi:alpha-tubulin suppressor-like RCC1 family protein